ncbi:MAG: hypothetical protein ACI8XO_002237 [Verrucomicrobiales bacterium]|jgi:hypothetical protein
MMRNDTRDWRIKLAASVFHFRFQIRIWLALSVMFPAVSFAASPSDRADDEAIAQRFANEFAIAQAAGSDLTRIRGVLTGIEELRKGIPGSGRYANLIFRVDRISETKAKTAARYLSYDRNILHFHPPIHYTPAWISGVVERKRIQLGAELNHLLAERTAESFARVFGAARAATAQLNVHDVESAMQLLERGVTGQGAHSGTTFQFGAAQPNIRQRTKQLLLFHEGNLHFIKGAEQMSSQELRQRLREQRPGQLAQQIVAFYNSAQAIGADFGNPHTPGDIVAKLRSGVRATTQLGMQFFRLSATAPEDDWRRAIAYLRFQNRVLSYSPPTAP